jgi:hypothetical protein
VHTGVQQLRVKIQKQMAIREQKARRKNLTKYIPNAAAAIFTVQRAGKGPILLHHPRTAQRLPSAVHI